jgi:hypothetical protein
MFKRNGKWLIVIFFCLLMVNTVAIAGNNLLSLTKKVVISKLTNGVQDEVVTINYPSSFQPKGVDVDDYGNFKIIRLTDYEKELVYDMHGKLLSKYGCQQDDNANVCYEFDKSGNVYRLVQSALNGFSIEKKAKNSSSWTHLAKSNDQIEVTENGNLRKIIHGPYNSPATKIVQISNSGQETTLVNMPGRTLYFGCGTLDDSFILNEFDQKTRMEKYYEHVNGKLKYLGEASLEEYGVSDHVIYNGRPIFAFYKDKKFYHFVNNMPTLLKDYSNLPNTDGVALSNNNVYTYKFK